MSNQPEGRNDASYMADRPDGDHRDVRSELDREREPDLGAQGKGLDPDPRVLDDNDADLETLIERHGSSYRPKRGGIAQMATVVTGDPYLDRMAHAVAIDFLRSDT